MYLDPGFGGMLLQALVVIAAVGGGVVFSFRKKIRRLFSKNNKNTDADNIVKQNTEGTEDDADIVDVLSEKEDK